MESSSKIAQELLTNPRRFRATGGYERMLNLLRHGCASEEVRMVLRHHSDVAGDVLWTVAQLEDVAAFASDAGKYLSSPDKATAAYATEIVLRGSADSAQLREVLDRLSEADVAVCEHAVRTLAGEGMLRLVEILRLAGGAWRALSEELALGPLQRETVEALLTHRSRGFQAIGVILATLAYEKDKTARTALERSTEAWIRGYGAWLTNE